MAALPDDVAPARSRGVCSTDAQTQSCEALPRRDLTAGMPHLSIRLRAVSMRQAHLLTKIRMRAPPLSDRPLTPCAVV